MEGKPAMSAWERPEWKAYLSKVVADYKVELRKPVTQKDWDEARSAWNTRKGETA